MNTHMHKTNRIGLNIGPGIELQLNQDNFCLIDRVSLSVSINNPVLAHMFPPDVRCPSRLHRYVNIDDMTPATCSFSPPNSYNSLTEVEGSEFRSLRKLEMLMLHGNDISAVHSGAFYNLRSLQVTLVP